MPITEDQVREELKKVIDPELFVNIVDLGLIYVVDLQTPGDRPDRRHDRDDDDQSRLPRRPAVDRQQQAGRQPDRRRGEVEVKIVMEPALDARPHDRRRPRSTGHLLTSRWFK